MMSILLVGLTSCTSRHSAPNKHDGLTFKYAKLCSLDSVHGITEVTIFNPWIKDQVLETFRLSKQAHGKDVIAYPQRVIVFTAAHCQLMQYLGIASRIVGVCDAQYIGIPEIQKRIKDGAITDCGNAMSPDIEKIISLNPDAIILSPFENGGQVKKLKKLGIPLIQAADYMEPTALGRAEWIKLYGRMFGVSKKGDSLFHVVDSTYHSLKNIAQKLPKGKSILTERKYGNVWYTPGGQSTIASIYKDANAPYAFAYDTHSGSLSLSFEEILNKAGNSDIWIFKSYDDSPTTKEGLLKEYAGYRLLKAFKENNVYECNTKQRPYFEEIPFRPDYLLKEVIQLSHPSLDLGGLRYYRHI